MYVLFIIVVNNGSFSRVGIIRISIGHEWVSPEFWIQSSELRQYLADDFTTRKVLANLLEILYISIAGKSKIRNEPKRKFSAMFEGIFLNIL